jgi:orotidine-5'-phosphate decarboxylase
MHMMDQLQEQVIRLQNPTVVGLDTRYEYLPEDFADRFEKTPRGAAQAIFEYNKVLIDTLADIIPAAKVQAAFYEMYGLPGMECFKKTLDYAKKAGMIVMADAKRGDIGSTAEAYSKTFLGQAKINDMDAENFACDILTVNPYFGIDGIKPFAEDCARHEKGIFVLVKTSNPSGGEFQDLLVDGKPLYERVAEKVEQWGSELIGRNGYSSVGAVVGATYPEQGSKLRKQLQHTYFLVPGYGAQGAKGADLAGCFDEKGGGAIVNASRSIICAHKKQPGVYFADASRKEALRMKEDLLSALGIIG